jgi:acyl carrier protein
MYRSGDRAQRLPDGLIEFLGRSDDQVKVRGVRLEPAEIEAALVEHRGVGQAAVISVDNGGEPMLVGYVVGVPGMTPPATVLRRHLMERLPTYAIPSHFVLLDALPMTPSGKLDRLALPPIESAARDSDAPCVAPRTDTERAVAAIWSDLLKVSPIGVYDNFFELGGHSLLMTQVMLRLREQLDADVRMESFFQAPTVAGLAAAVVNAKAAATDPQALDELLAMIDQLSDEQLEVELTRRGAR